MFEQSENIEPREDPRDFERKESNEKPESFELNKSMIRFYALMMIAMLGLIGTVSCSKDRGKEQAAVLFKQHDPFRAKRTQESEMLNKNFIQLDEVKSLKETLLFLAKDLYDLKHPESVIGDWVTDEEINRYKAYKIEQSKKAKRKKLKLGIEEFEEYLKNKEGIVKNIGKVTMYRLDPEMTLRHMAVSKFLLDRIDTTCEAVFLTSDECLLYHIITFENSGGLWKKSSANAVGPGQIMPHWFKLQKNLPGNPVENFFLAKNKKKKFFDGRYDPIANIEMGAKIFKYCIDLLGKNHPDFAILAYNQGENDLMDFAEAWAKKHKKNDVEKWLKDNKLKSVGRSKYKEFLDFLGTPLAEMLKDTKLSEKYMSSDNGGKGYLSKILALYEISKNPAEYGIKPKAVESFPVRADENLKVDQWDDLFEEKTMPAGKSLDKFAKENGYSLNQLKFINRHIFDENAKFKTDVRIWVLKMADIPYNFIPRLEYEGKMLLTKFELEKVKQTANKKTKNVPKKIFKNNKKNPEYLPRKTKINKAGVNKKAPAPKFYPKKGSKILR